MALLQQPVPWVAFANREIGDAAGNIVQYTQSNVGFICLAVNAHDRLMDALGKVEAWMSKSPAERTPDADMLAMIKTAIGKIGVGALAVRIEVLTAPSPEIDRAIAVELQLPEATYTGSIDSALTLVPAGWSYSVSTKAENRQTDANGATEAVTSMVIDMKAPDGRVVSATNVSMAIALAAAAVEARNLM